MKKKYVLITGSSRGIGRACAVAFAKNGYHVFTEDGKVTFSAKEQGYYDTLSYLHDLYQEELIDHDI